MKKKDNIKNKVTEKTTEGEWIKIFNINKEEEETGEEFQGTHVDPKTGMPFLHQEMIKKNLWLWAGFAVKEDFAHWAHCPLGTTGEPTTT